MVREWELIMYMESRFKSVACSSIWRTFSGDFESSRGGLSQAKDCFGQMFGDSR